MSKNIPVKNEKAIPCKVILVGESGVGKTFIISRYLNRYQEKTEPTLGAYFSNKILVIDGYKLNLEIWDTAGQEQYRSINNLFYKDSYICLLVYDITNKTTFNCIRDYWYEAVCQNGPQGIIFGVAGNKNDLYEEEDVTENEAKEFSKSIDACFKLTSAHINTSIDDIFEMLGQKFIQSDFMKQLIPKYINKNNTNEEQKNENANIKLQKEDINNNNTNSSNTNKKYKKKGFNCC